MRRNCKQHDKLRSEAEHPKGIAGAAIPYKFINGFIAAAAMVWHDCLLTTNDEHLFTGEAWGLCGGKEARICGVGFLLSN